MRHIGVHDVRKTCATLLVDLDVHPRVIMRVLRHADLGVTMEIYANASSASTRAALRRLGEALSEAYSCTLLLYPRRRSRFPEAGGPGFAGRGDRI